MTTDDIPSFAAALVAIPSRHDVPGYASKCLDEQEKGRRDVFGAFVRDADVMAGFVHLIWNPAYPPFVRLGMPEVQDLAVLPDFRRRGLGRELVLRCEEEAASRGCRDIGIGVGLYAAYGAAQRLYVNMGYVPDGCGIAHDNISVTGGRMYPVDDLLTLKMTKKLGVAS